MKNLIGIAIVFLLAGSAIAQDTVTHARVFKKFKVNLSLGYAIPQYSSTTTGTNFSGGALFAIEPKFAVIDPLSIGLRAEVAVMGHVNTNTSNNSSQSNSNGKANGSYLLTADYYFTSSKFRPFIGAGGGVFITANIDSNTVNSSNGNIPRTSQFGFMARAGFELGHLRIGAEYNFVSNNASYIGLKLGVCFGGGRKKTHL